jgi:hypothetical protein
MSPSDHCGWLRNICRTPRGQEKEEVACVAARQGVRGEGGGVGGLAGVDTPPCGDPCTDVGRSPWRRRMRWPFTSTASTTWTCSSKGIKDSERDQKNKIKNPQSLSFFPFQEHVNFLVFFLTAFVFRLPSMGRKRYALHCLSIWRANIFGL